MSLNALVTSFLAPLGVTCWCDDITAVTLYMSCNNSWP